MILGRHMTSSRQPVSATAYGARPVSIDIARGRRLTRAAASEDVVSPATRTTPPLSHQVVADRLSLAHWPPGHQIVISALSGGTGRTTFAGLLATVLAEQPFAHIWHPIAVVEAAPRTLGTTARRWDLVEPSQSRDATSSRSGAWAVTGGSPTLQRNDFSAVVVDAPAAMPSDLPCIKGDPSASIVLLTRPDRVSLADAADALVWMNDRSRISRDQVVVVINRGVGEPDRGSRAAATALGIRCAAVHSLPFSSALGPGRVLPSGRDVPIRVRRLVSNVALDLWFAAVNRRRPVCVPDKPEEPR